MRAHTLPPGATQVSGGGPSREAGDGVGRVGLQLQHGSETAGVSGQSNPEEEPHPHHRRGHGQRGSQVLLKSRLSSASRLSFYLCSHFYVCVCAQDRWIDPENHTGQVQRVHRADNRSSPQHHHWQWQDTGEHRKYERMAARVRQERLEVDLWRWVMFHACVGNRFLFGLFSGSWCRKHTCIWCTVHTTTRSTWHLLQNGAADRKTRGSSFVGSI